MQREPYLRGRAMLSGLRWHRFSLRERIDFAEAVLLEPAMHGSWTHVDEALDKLTEAVMDADPTSREETWGKLPSHQDAMRRTEERAPPVAGWEEAMWAKRAAQQAQPPPDEPPVPD